jgi:hypothetical protein
VLKPPRLILEIDIGERLSVVVAHDEAGVVVFLDGPWRREAALSNSSGNLAKFAAMRRVSLRVSFVVLCVMVLCGPMVRLAGNSLLLGV